MRYIKNYKNFKKLNEIKNILEGVEHIVIENLNKEKTDKELVKETPEEEKSRIENIIKKHFNKEIDLDISPKPPINSEYDNPEKNKNEKSENPEKNKNLEDESKNEAAILTAITIASLLPVAMEAVGKLSNLLKRKFGINLTEEDLKKLEYYNNAIAAYNKILKKGSAKFQGEEYTLKNWKEIGEKLYELVKNEDVKVGKKLKDDHHNTNDDQSNKNVDNKEKNNSENENNNEKENVKNDNIENDKKLIENEINKLKKIRDKLFGTSFAEWLKNKGHELHHAYTTPIRLALYGLAKISKKDSKLRDEKFREKIANVIYAITMVSLAGIGIWEGLSSLSGVNEVGSIILKGIEGGLNTSEIRKQAISALLKST